MAPGNEKGMPGPAESVGAEALGEGAGVLVPGRMNTTARTAATTTTASAMSQRALRGRFGGA